MRPYCLHLLERRLDPSWFVRLTRGTLVNIDWGYADLTTKLQARHVARWDLNLRVLDGLGVFRILRMPGFTET
jgi:hypothetical protein